MAKGIKPVPRSQGENPVKAGDGRAAVREDETGKNQCSETDVKEPGVGRYPSQKNCGKLLNEERCERRPSLKPRILRCPVAAYP